MTDQLFRQEAIEAKADTSLSTATVAAPIRASLVAATAVGFAIAVVSVAVFGVYAKKETVPGIITTTEGNVRVYPRAGGIISSISVEEGEAVTKGQLLAAVSTSRATANNTSVQESLVSSMLAEAGSVRDQIDRTQQIANEQIRGLQRQLANANQQLASLHRQKESAAERLTLLMKDLQRKERMRVSDLVSEMDLDNSRAVVLEARLSLETIDSQIAETNNVVERLKLDLSQSPTVSARTIAELHSELRQLEQRTTSMESEDSVAVIAPIDGKVATLGRRVGQRISESTPVLSILPSESEYYAELYVPSRSIGFVHIGTEVRIRYDAFPYQTYGVHTGIVTHISATPVRPQEADAAIPLTELSYLLRVAIEQTYVQVGPDRVSLQPGMQLQADVIQDRKRIIEWLFDPMQKALQRMQ